jgi:hypothetical protein
MQLLNTKYYFMKGSIILTALVLFLFTSCKKSSVDNNSNGTDITVVSASAVPQAVRTTFDANFSGATEIEWHHSSTHFASQFNLNGQRHDAEFDDNGHQSSHTVICLEAPVPQVVLDAFRTRFPTDNVYEWNLRTDGTWKAHFMRGTVKYEATYSATGVLIKFEQA